MLMKMECAILTVILCVAFPLTADASMLVSKIPSIIVSVPRYTAFALTLSHDDSPYANPFWDVSVSAVFTSPGGVQYTIEGFYYDSDKWMVRFGPVMEGMWTYSVVMSNGGDSYATTGTFECVSSGLHGSIRSHPANRGRLIYDDGVVFNPMGTNIWEYQYPFIEGTSTSGSTYRERWDRYFDEYEAHKCNAYRRLIGIEMPPPQHIAVWGYDTDANSYSLARAKNLDEEFASARYHNIALIVALMDKEDGRDWSRNPLNAANGGPVTSQSNLFDVSNTAAVGLVKKYYRYMVARYSAYVDVWQLFNENDSGYGLTLEWKEMMAAHLRSYDPYRHFVCNSTVGQAPVDAYQDMRTPHLYLGYYMPEDDLVSGILGSEQVAREFDNWINSYTGPSRAANLPCLFSEFGTGEHMPNDYPNAWRVAIWSGYLTDSGMLFWDDNQSLPITSVGAYGSYPRTWNGNAYLSPVTKDYFGVLQAFGARFPQTMENVNPSTNDSSNLRVFGLQNQSLGLYAAWVHNYVSHSATNTGKTLTITLPTGSYIAEWVNTKTGSLAASPSMIGGGSQTLSVPSFLQDIALAVRPNASVDIVTASLPDAPYGTEYYEVLEARGGGRPYTWTLLDSALPEGMTLDTESGLISGAPRYNGTYSFTAEVLAQDSSTDLAVFSITSTGAAIPEETPVMFDFSTAGDAEGWSNANDLSALTVSGGVVSTGWTGADPYMTRSGLTVTTDSVPEIFVRMSTTYGGVNGGELFWATSDEPGYSADKAQKFDTVADGNFHVYTLDLSGHAKWTGKIVTKLRLDALRGSAGQTIRVDFIRSAMPAINFQFNTDGDTERWTVASDLDPLAVAGGLLATTTRSADGYIRRSDMYAVGNEVPQLEIRMRVGGVRRHVRQQNSSGPPKRSLMSPPTSAWVSSLQTTGSFTHTRST